MNSDGYDEDPTEEAAFLYAQPGRIEVARTYPFDDVSKLETVEYQLPQSVYSGALIVLLGDIKAEEDDDGGCDCGDLLASFLISVPQWLCLVMSSLMQIGFIHYINGETSKIGPCGKRPVTSPTLVYLAIALFVGGMMGEYIETFGMLAWTCTIKTESTHKKLEVVASYDEKEHERTTWINSGLTLPVKIIFVVLVIIPKMIIALYLTHCGIKFVALAEKDTDLVLNCLAMMFVVSVDELFYITFTPGYIRGILTALPPVVGPRNPYAAIFSVFIAPSVKILFWAGLVKVAVDHYACPTPIPTVPSVINMTNMSAS